MYYISVYKLIEPGVSEGHSSADYCLAVVAVISEHFGAQSY